MNHLHMASKETRDSKYNESKEINSTKVTKETTESKQTNTTNTTNGAIKESNSKNGATNTNTIAGSDVMHAYDQRAKDRAIREHTYRRGETHDRKYQNRIHNHNHSSSEDKDKAGRKHGEAPYHRASHVISNYNRGSYRGYRGFGGNRGSFRGGGYNNRNNRDNHNVTSTREGGGNAREVVNFFKRHLFELHIKPRDNILDLCCGIGGDLNKYGYLRAASVLGLDISQNSIVQAQNRCLTGKIKSNNVEVRLEQTDLRRNVFRINPQVDVVSCQLALHYFWGHSDHINNILTTVEDSLKSGGYFLLTILDETKIPINGCFKHPYVSFSPVYPLVSSEVRKQEVVFDDDASTQDPKFIPLLSQSELNSQTPLLSNDETKKDAQGEINAKSVLSNVEFKINNPISTQNSLSKPIPEIQIQDNKIQDAVVTVKRLAYRFSFESLVQNTEEVVIPHQELLRECEAHHLKYQQSFSVRDVWDRIQGFYPGNGNRKNELSSNDWFVLDLFRAYVFTRS